MTPTPKTQWSLTKIIFYACGGVFCLYLFLRIFFPAVAFALFFPLSLSEYFITTDIKRSLQAQFQKPTFQKSGEYYITYLPEEVRDPYEEGVFGIDFVKKNYDEAIELIDHPYFSSGMYTWRTFGGFTVGRSRAYRRNQFDDVEFRYRVGNVEDQQFPFDKTVEEVRSMIDRHRIAKAKWQEGLLGGDPQKNGEPYVTETIEEVEVEPEVRGVYVTRSKIQSKEVGTAFLLFEKDGKRFEFAGESDLVRATKLKPSTAHDRGEMMKQELLKSARSLKNVE